MEYPEHEKLEKVQAESQACGEFLSWLAFEKGLELCAAEFDEDEWYPQSRTITDLLAEFFGIDSEALEAEKRQMLAELRGE